MDIAAIISALDAVLNNPNATPEEMAGAIQAAREALQSVVDSQAASADPIEAAKAIDVVAEKIAKVSSTMEARKKILSLSTKNREAIDRGRTPADPAPPAGRVSNDKVIDTRGRKSRVFAKTEDAVRAGYYYLSIFGEPDSETRTKAKQWCVNHDVKASMTQANETSAGLFVPDEIENTIWALRESYGVARRLFNVTTGTSATKTKFKRTNDLTTYFIGEGATPTDSQLQYQAIQLSAKTLATLTKYSGLLDEDSVVSIADEITNDAAYALALREDQCAFIGTGTSTYGGMIGASYVFRKALEDGGGTWATDADKAKLGGVFVAAGSTWASVTRADIIALMGQVNQYAGFVPSFLTHSTFYYQVMLPLITAQGGATQTELVGGVSTPMWMGYPVVFSQVMPQATAVSSVPLLFGDFSKGAEFFDRRGMTVAEDRSKGFSEGDIYVRVTERFDVNVHDYGNYHATAASRTRGSIAGLVTKNS